MYVFPTASCSFWCLNLFLRYDGAGIVERSIELGEPVIYVSMNYRVSGMLLPPRSVSTCSNVPFAGFGFLASQEVKDAGVGNLGLQDRK